MFIEPGFSNSRRGWIEVICGSMFSGKSEELIRRLKRALIAHQKVEIFKPATDKRFHDEKIVSHDRNAISSQAIANSSEILRLAWGVDVVGIDEAQFFDENLSEVCEELALKGVRVIIAGLDKDYLGKPFGPMPQLLCQADYLTKLHAVCVQCGSLATHSYRLTEEDTQFMLGAKGEYEARCRHCFTAGSKAHKVSNITVEKMEG